MAETITFYAGTGKTGADRKRALEREARRRRMSVSDLVWEGLAIGASAKFREALDKAKEKEKS